MAEFRWIKTSLVLILVLQFTAAATGQKLIYITVRDGDEVTLSCDSVIDDQKNCDSTTWLFVKSRSTTAVKLVTDGKIDEAKDKSERLSVSENCSLIIKKVTDEDVGRYTCRQFRSGRQYQDAQVYLFVVTMTEHKNSDEVKLICSVKTPEGCRHKVKWMFRGEDVDKEHKDIKTSQTFCFTSLEFLTSYLVYTSRFNSLTCEVTDGDKVQKFPFRISHSGDKTGEDTTTTTTTTTKDTQAVWWYVIVAVVLVALLIIIIIVAVIKWKRTNGNTTRTDGNVGLTSDPAPKTSQDMADPEEGVSYASVSFTKKTNSEARADPEEGVSYASVSFTKKTNSEAQGRRKRDDDDDAVTYTTVNSSSANPSNLYSTIT